ncbi:MAG: tryptophan--tRNA ligase [Pseudomonadota bacterium]
MARILSGIKPSGDLTLGNYIGAIRNFVKLQDQHECFFCIVDQHAITVPQEKLELRKRILDIAALYIACGIDPEKSTIFIQSEVPAHAQLGWIMECHTYMGELNRMTQFKDKTRNGSEKALSAGLFTYPSLMAADIILYDADLVPVGDDQKQHVELTRELVQRFNNKYGDIFTLPETFIPNVGARIADLQDPTKKMSKSDDSDKGYILLLDDLKRIEKKVKSAVTDSGTEVKFDKDKKPGIANLMSIYSVFTELKFEEIEKKYEGSNYGTFKQDLANIVVEKIKPIQDRFNEIRNSDKLAEILDAGAEKANNISYKKLKKVENKLGLGRKI